MRRPAWLLPALLILAACSEPKKAPRLAETLPNIPLPPRAEVVSRENGEDAIKIRFRSQATPDAVSSYYRDILSKPPWTLVSDNRTEDGKVALYAEQAGPPLWVTIWKAEGAEGTFIDLAGARTR